MDSSRLKNPPATQSLKKILPLLSPGQRRELRYLLRYNGNQRTSQDEHLYDILLERERQSPQKRPQLAHAVVERGTLPATSLNKTARSLFGKVLDVVRESNKTYSLEKQLYDAVCDAKFLAQQEFVTETKTAIARAKTLAHQIDRPEILLDIIALQREFLLAKDKREFQHLETALQREADAAKSAYFNLLHHAAQHTQILRLKESSDRTPNDTLRALALKLPPENTTEITAFRTLRYHLSSWAYFHYISTVNLKVKFTLDSREEHWKRSFVLRKKIAELYQQPAFAHFQTAEPEWFFTDTTFYLSYCILDFEHAQIYPAIEALERRFDNDVEYFRHVGYLHLLLFTRLVQHRQAGRFIREKNLEERLAKVQGALADTQMILFYQMFLETSFYHEDWAKCLYWSGKIWFDIGKEIRPEIKVYAGILEIIALWEQGLFDQYETAESLVLKLRRRDVARFREIEVFGLFLKFQADLVKNGRRISPKKLAQWHAKFTEVFAESQVLELYNDILAWLDVKLGRAKTLLEISEKKAQDLAAQHQLEER